MTPRIYSNTAVQTSLVSGITAAVTSLTVADATGYPAAPFAIVVDAGSATYEEVMLVTAKAGVVFTVTRAYDGTTAKVHAAGALVIHAAIADDFRGMQLGTRDVSSVAPGDGDVITWDAANAIWEPGAGGSSAAPASATYVTLTANAALTAEAVLGSAVIMAGLAAARPAAATAGRIYYATDTDTLSRDNGSGWDDLTIDWGQITGEPTTLAGYGITDGATDAELVAHEADTTAVHGIANTANLIKSGDAAGGDLAGTYPSPTVATDAITYAKIQNVSATDRVLGRSTAGAGDMEEITFTAAARALADDATAAAMLVTLGAGITPTIVDFTSTNTSTIPTGCTVVRLLGMGGGGGGGSGRRGAAGTARFGGGGGGGSSLSEAWYTAAELGGAGTVLTATVGAGGAAGAARTTDDTDGATGGTGGNTTIAAGAQSLLTAGGGVGGGGGTAAAGAAGAGGSAFATFAGTVGGQSVTTGSAANGTNNPQAPAGAGGGGGIDAANVQRAGGVGGVGGRLYVGSGAVGGTGGAAGGTNGGNAATAILAQPGSGAGGGGGNAAGVGGTGGVGDRGGAGAGGGASLNGNNSGAGGAGGGGWARIVYF